MQKRLLVEVMYKLNSFRFGDDNNDSLDHPLPVEIQGNTDSEYLSVIYLICLFLRAKERGREKINTWDSFELEDMRLSLLDTIEIVTEVQERVLDNDQLMMAASSLNICVTDGERLVATRFRSQFKDGPEELPPSLYYSNSAGIVLDRRYPGNPNDNNRLQSERSWKLQSDPKIHAPHVVVVSDPPS
jgi:glutamine amidotransferase